MNNSVEKSDFFEFPIKVKSQHSINNVNYAMVKWQVESIRGGHIRKFFRVKFPQDLTYRRLLKYVNL